MAINLNYDKLFYKIGTIGEKIEIQGKTIGLPDYHSVFRLFRFASQVDSFTIVM